MISLTMLYQYNGNYVRQYYKVIQIAMLDVSILGLHPQLLNYVLEAVKNKKQNSL
jgi:hypothetical protein